MQYIPPGALRCNGAAQRIGMREVRRCAKQLGAGRVQEQQLEKKKKKQAFFQHVKRASDEDLFANLDASDDTTVAAAEILGFSNSHTAPFYGVLQQRERQSRRVSLQ
jgi:hypothetical protein